eukprot:2519113-Prymnesium_polylepis.1
MPQVPSDAPLLHVVLHNWAHLLTTMSMGWAGPSPAPSFALISPFTITHNVCVDVSSVHQVH